MRGSTGALHAAALVANEPWAVQIARVCACAEVELLRYPVPLNRQSPGQTMATGAIAKCLKRFGEATLITALQCVTQTANNQPGALTALTIKALCDVLHRNQEWRESGLALLDAFDSIDLQSIQEESTVEATIKRTGRVQAMSECIQVHLRRLIASQDRKEGNAPEALNAGGHA